MRNYEGTCKKWSAKKKDCRVCHPQGVKTSKGGPVDTWLTRVCDRGVRSKPTDDKLNAAECTPMTLFIHAANRYESVPEKFVWPTPAQPLKFNLLVRQLLVYGVSRVNANLRLWLAVRLGLIVIVLQLFSCCLWSTLTYFFTIRTVWRLLAAQRQSWMPACNYKPSPIQQYHNCFATPQLRNRNVPFTNFTNKQVAQLSLTNPRGAFYHDKGQNFTSHVHNHAPFGGDMLSCC